MHMHTSYSCRSKFVILPRQSQIGQIGLRSVHTNCPQVMMECYALCVLNEMSASMLGEVGHPLRF